MMQSAQVQHIPVLLDEVIAKAAEMPRLEWYFDGTFGRGGHLRAMFERFPGLRAVAMDCDEQAINYGRESFAGQIAEKSLTLVRGNYGDFINKLAEQGHGETQFDYILLDLGVSSPQLDEAERGFSFYHDGPLDMRMDHSQKRTAADVVNDDPEEVLVQIFSELGEVQRPQRVIRAIVQDRKLKRFERTRDLAGLIERVEGWTRKGHHPATRYFLGLRLFVNQELEHLEKVVPALIGRLRPEGRIAILTFHSLEDRIVKNLFRELTDMGRPVNKKVIQVGWHDRGKNPRARSAKLRVFTKSGGAV